MLFLKILPKNTLRNGRGRLHNIDSGLKCKHGVNAGGDDDDERGLGTTFISINIMKCLRDNFSFIKKFFSAAHLQRLSYVL